MRVLVCQRGEGEKITLKKLMDRNIIAVKGIKPINAMACDSENLKKLLKIIVASSCRLSSEL
jgi:hypothetical protein